MKFLFIGHQMGAEETVRAERVMAGKSGSLLVRDLEQREQLEVALQSIFPVEGVE